MAQLSDPPLLHDSAKGARPSGTACHLLVESLAPTGDSAAYALARTCRSGLAASDWERFVARWSSGDGERGVLTAKSTRGAVLGVVGWWIQPDLEGDLMLAGPFIVREIGVRPLVQEALVGRLREIAEARGLRLLLVDWPAANDAV